MKITVEVTKHSHRHLSLMRFLTGDNYQFSIEAENKALHLHGVMQAEASASAKGAAVGNSAAGKGVSGGINCPNCGNEWDMTKHNACQCGAQLRGELLR